MKQILLAILFCLLLQASAAQNGNQQINLKDITDGEFLPQEPREIQPLADGEYYAMLNADSTKILKYSYKDGKEAGVLFDVNTVRETKLDAIDGYIISSTGYHIIVWTNKEYIYRRSWKADLYDYDVRRNFLKPLSDTPGKLMIPTFSPDGRMCAFVRDNNIWLKKFDFDTESQVTKDGEFEKILNGVTDWVYEEEFYTTNLMAWSPDSKMLAFVKFDESQVPTHQMQVFDGSLYPGFKSFKYPKAGLNNSVVACYSYSVDTKDVKKLNVPIPADSYIPLIKFTTNSEQLAVMTLNRAQNIFSMYYANPKSAVAKLVLQDENKYYFEPDFLKYITFTPDNFVYLSEKDGYMHIYLYSSLGVLQKQLTSGTWDVTACYGIDSETQFVFYQSAEESPLRRSIYKVDFKGNKTKLSQKSGTNKADFSANFKYFVNRYSNLATPTVTTINESSKGRELLTLEDNQALKNKLSNSRFASKEFFTVKNENGMELNGWMVKPLNFSASDKYPVVMYQYSGPDSQEALDRFDFDWEYYLSSIGYIVVCVDGRGTGCRGEEFRKCTYLNLGQFESDDQIAVANYMASQPYVDKNKIAIWGWSYGGYITLMSMSRGNGIFKTGIAVAPITDWKFYDTIYTERYMRTPNENFTGYANSSPIQLAGKLQGNLLLIYGTSDNNVHIQNTLYYSEALVEAGKQFDMQIYSGKNHSLLGNKTRYHLYTRMTDFLNTQLK
ncbi:MAG: S9 family peptidase [Candidatus Azobacteroides sp.]|nr:S9 family peptidase [Candidatus Azobacteroides sp.]